MLFTEFNMEDALEVRGEEKFEEGLEQGMDVMLTVVSGMTADGRAAEIPRLKEDAAFLKEMMEKYKIDR